LIIGTDLDGVITSVGLYSPETKLPWWCAVWLIFVPPNRKMVETLKRWRREGNEIIIVSARPKRLTNLTRWWLKRYRVPFNQLYIVGTGIGVKQRKLKIIQNTEIELFIDDDPKIVDFLRKAHIKVRFP